MICYFHRLVEMDFRHVEVDLLLDMQGHSIFLLFLTCIFGGVGGAI